MHARSKLTVPDYSCEPGLESLIVVPILDLVRDTVPQSLGGLQGRCCGPPCYMVISFFSSSWCKDFEGHLEDKIYTASMQSLYKQFFVCSYHKLVVRCSFSQRIV